ncbi:Endonuclease/exonuclease/phosphatase [Pilobolus umbonatus]|nr:Endonuclease/exonuclease/phosphatase [Pilobolus umbonatus]
MRRGRQQNEQYNTFPDLSRATRSPPYHKSRYIEIVASHKGSLHAITSSRNLLITGGHSLKLWDPPSPHSRETVNLEGNNNQANDNEKVRAVIFAPGQTPADEGRYLWVAHQETSITIIDTRESRSKVLPTLHEIHTSPISFLLRYRNSEIWSIDDSGLLAVWDLADPRFPTYETYQISHNSTVATIYDSKLWLFGNRNITAYSITEGKSRIDTKCLQSVRLQNELGYITQMISLPYHPHRIFASHDNGKISVWDSQTLEKLQVITVSLYGICTMVSVGDFYIWAGYNTGMIYVYDTRFEKWVVLKMWKAHAGAVNHLTIDESSLILDKPGSTLTESDEKLLVISSDSNGVLHIWDGFLRDYWKDFQLSERSKEFSEYENIRTKICSWNIGANKPDRFSEEDESRIKEWLYDKEYPAIIAVGIQEIVDLESKKQTARSLFFKKKNDSTETEEVLTHRYKLWHDYLVRIMAELYGVDAYFVVKTDQLVGLFSCIFVRSTDREFISNVEATSVKTGLKVMNKSVHGNKGGVVIRLMYKDSSLCFLNCHLAAGQFHTKQRNADVECILQNAEFSPCNKFLSRFVHGGDGTYIFDHEYCVLSGDLNYRIQMERSEVMNLLKSTLSKEKIWIQLLSEDQLKKQYYVNPFSKLLSFEEADIRFDPTYKYDLHCNRYDQSEKKRVPAWCDRILFKGNDIQSLYYNRYEVMASDHRPISAGLIFQIKKVDMSKYNAIELKVDEEWKVYRRKYIQDRKAKYIDECYNCSLAKAYDCLKKANWDIDDAVNKLKSGI